MSKKLRQEILREFESLGGLSLNRKQKYEIKKDPSKIALFLLEQNKTFSFVNLDEAKFALEALQTITTPQQAQKFMQTWNSSGGEGYEVSLRGGFIRKGNDYQKQIKVEGKRIIDLASKASSETSSEFSATPVASATSSDSNPTSISCKRCKGLGLGCSGKDVAELHIILTKLGFIKESNQEINEQKFGTFTQSVVKQFQKSRRLKDDGIVGPRTCLALGLIKPKTNKPSQKKTPAEGGNTGKCSKGNPAPFGIDSNCFRLDFYINKFGFAVDLGEYNKNPKEAEKKYAETKPTPKESKNFYDNKKLNEAKQLFDKLLKRI